MFNHIFLLILQNARSKISQSLCNPVIQKTLLKKERKKTSPPPRKISKSNSILSIKHSREKEFPRMLGTIHSPSIIRHSSAYYSREDQKMRVKRWIVRASTGNSLKKLLKRGGGGEKKEGRMRRKKEKRSRERG